MGSRRVLIVVGVVVTLFGAGCLNYTNAWDLARHTKEAAEGGFPAPSRPIFFAGIALTLIGGFTIGQGMARRRQGGSPGA